MSFTRRKHAEPLEEFKPIVKAEEKKETPPPEEKKLILSGEIIKEEITKANIKTVNPNKKTRADYNTVGLTGDSIECKDFRAIVKKSGKNINAVLSSILHEWNKKNYNL